MSELYMFHGKGSGPDRAWFPWLDEKMTELGYDVTRVSMPKPMFPIKGEWHETIERAVKSGGPDTYILAHSQACLAVLDYLNFEPRKVELGGVVLVSPFTQVNYDTVKSRTKEVLEDKGVPKWLHPVLTGVSVHNSWLWMNPNLDWPLLQSRSNYVVVGSDNDPYVDNGQMKDIAEKLGASYREFENKGHFSDEEDFPGLVDILTGFTIRDLPAVNPESIDSIDSISVPSNPN